MAFEKAKVLKAAERFLSQGKIEAAIKEYRQIVENDDDDFTTLNMLGDLCVRAGKKDEAISCFVRIAEHYRDQEFTLKSIAMYKKVERLQPKDPEIAKNLASLYAAQGLIVDARAQYLIVADSYSRAGHTKQALEVLRKIADLDPHNIEIRLKLAASYLKEGLEGDAATAFKEAGARLLEAGSFEKALEAFSRAIEFRPYEEKALAGMLAAHIAMGTADEAAEQLEKTVADRPEEVEFVRMLASAYLAAEDAKGAERATAKLMDRDASKYMQLVPVAQLYLKTGDIDDAARILASIIEPMLAGREEKELLELVDEILARNPEHVETLRLLVRIHWWQRDMEKLRSALERLAESAQAAELVEEERYALIQLIRLAPDEPRYLERLNQLGGAPEESLGQSVFAGEKMAEEIPSFENFAVVPEQGEEAEAHVQPEFETNSLTEPSLGDPSASFAELGDAFTGNTAETEANHSEAAGPVEFDFDTSGVSDAGQTQATQASMGGDKSRREVLMHQELESVDFYLSQGYFDIAADTLQMLEKEYGSNAEIDTRKQKLHAATNPDEAVTFEMAGEPARASHDKSHGHTLETQPDAVRSNASRIDSGLAEIFQEFKSAAEDESFENEDYETHYNMGTAYKEMDLVDEAIQEFQTAASLVKPGDGTPRYLQCCNMLGHCFLKKNMSRAAVIWFKKGLESPGHTEEEYLALRYELGLAYEQMGDFHRATESFTEVYGVNISYRGVADKLNALQQHKSNKKKKSK